MGRWRTRAEQRHAPLPRKPGDLPRSGDAWCVARRSRVRRRPADCSEAFASGARLRSRPCVRVRVRARPARRRARGRTRCGRDPAGASTSIAEPAPADRDPERSPALDEVVVIGRRPRGQVARDPTASATVIEAKRFAGEAKGVAELVATAPGVAVSDYGGLGQLATVSIRGATSTACSCSSTASRSTVRPAAAWTSPPSRAPGSTGSRSSAEPRGRVRRGRAWRRRERRHPRARRRPCVGRGDRAAPSDTFAGAADAGAGVARAVLLVAGSGEAAADVSPTSRRAAGAGRGARSPSTRA